MSGFARHLVVRLRACASEPGSALVLVLSALATVLFWPGTLTPEGAWRLPGSAPEQGAAGAVMLVLWLAFWPAMPAIVAAGRAVTESRRESAMARAVPALPVGRVARMAAEALVVLLPVLAVHVPLLFAGGEVRLLLGYTGPFAGDAAFRAAVAGDALLGAVLMLPTLLMWLAPASCMETMFWRPMALAAVLALAMRAGLLASPLSLVAVSAALSAVPVLAISRDWSRRRRRAADTGGAASRSRLFRPPSVQLVRDFVLRPLPLLAAVVVLEAVLVVADRAGSLPDMTLYWGSTLLLSVAFGFVGMRPMLSKQVIAGVWGAPGFRPGDFMGAWARMPVRPGSVLVGVWVHGAVAAAALWGVVLTVALLSRAADPAAAAEPLAAGAVGRIILPMALLLPSVPGLLAAAAVGDRTWSWICGLTLFLGVHLAMVMLIAGVPLWGRVAVLGVLAAVNLVGPLRLLRRPAVAATAAA